MKQIKVEELCKEFEQALIKKQLSNDSLRRYRDILTEFSLFSNEVLYSQRIGAEFLMQKFQDNGGVTLTDEFSKKQEFYFRCMRMLADYYAFGIVVRNTSAYGEIIWPDGFRECNYEFYQELIDSNLSYSYINQSKRLIMSLILFLDAQHIYSPDGITIDKIDSFIKTFKALSLNGINTKISLLKRYFRFLYLHSYIKVPFADRLPHTSFHGRAKYPTIWTNEQIIKIKESADRISPSGKRSYAMIMLAAELGLRIGDIRDLEFCNINWEKKTISIIQNKTGNSLELPFSDDLGWAVIDYLKNGRPITDSSKIFVKHIPPYDGFGVNSNLNLLLTKVLIKSDIPPEKKDNVGWHTFRRSLATHLLQNNVEIYNIAEILGHSDPSITSKYYVKLDLENLKCCMLEIEVKDYVK